MNKKYLLHIVTLTLIITGTTTSQVTDKEYKIIQYNNTIKNGTSLEKRILDKGERRIIAEVTLREGKSLGVHTENTPFIVYGIAGEGVLVLGDDEKSIPITSGVLVTVETGIAHDVVAKPNLSILVFKLIGDAEKNNNHEKK